MVCVPTHRITTHPGVLLLEPIREMGLSVHRVARKRGDEPALKHVAEQPSLCSPQARRLCS